MIEIGPNLLQAIQALAWVAGVSSVAYFLFSIIKVAEFRDG
jgi:hypothetical protein